MPMIDFYYPQYYFPVLFAGLCFPNQEFLRKEESSVWAALFCQCHPQMHVCLLLSGHTDRAPETCSWLSLGTPDSCISTLPVQSLAEWKIAREKEKSLNPDHLVSLWCVLTGSSWEGSRSYCYVNRFLCKSILLEESLCDVWELR